MSDAKFHPFMNEMTITVEKEFERDGETMIRGTDRQGRRFVTPKRWLDKPFLKKRYGLQPEPSDETFVVATFFSTGQTAIFERIGGFWYRPGHQGSWNWAALNEIAKVEVLVLD